MCHSPYKQLRAGWGFLVKCSHFNLKLSGFHHCHTPFAPKTHGRGCNLKHCIPHPRTRALPPSWRGPAQALGGVFWKGKVWLLTTFTAFPELPVHWLHTVKIQTGCNALFQRHSSVSRTAQIRQLFLRQNSSWPRIAAFGVTENQACFPRIMR